MRWTIPLVVLMACAGDPADDPSDTNTTETEATDASLPLVYSFPSRFDGEESVSTSGQVFRHLLISDLNDHLAGITGRIEAGEIFPVAGDIEGELNFYFEFDSATSGAIPILFDTDPGPMQIAYDDVSSGKDLVSKIAGNDEAGQHVDWSTGLVGWEDPAVTTPESLVRHWFSIIDRQSVGFGNGQPPLAPDGTPIRAVYLTPEGHDLRQLLEKFLRGAIAFSQGADDYLDDDEPGKGLLSDNTAAEDSENFTALEHGWDEGFGYFGAARSYPSWTDDQIADDRVWDADGDGTIDLKTEVCWGHSVNAAKRDRGSSAEAPNDFTAEAWEGFARGRQLLANSDGELTTAQLNELKMWRDQAVGSWEKAMGATVVHYINEVLQDNGKIGTDDYSFADHAKHWSELKGFALSLQFNPRSPVTDADFADLHELLGMAPVLAGDEALDAYAEDLLEARAIIGNAYGFDPANLGDQVGENGW